MPPGFAGGAFSLSIDDLFSGIIFFLDATDRFVIESQPVG